MPAEHQERGHQAYALCLLGDIAGRIEPPDSEPAEAHYEHALALAEALGMRPLQAHCHHGWHAVQQDGLCCPGPRCTLYRHRDVLRHGHDLLAAAG